MPVRARIVLGPHRIAVFPVASPAEAETEAARAGILRVHETREHIFGLLGIISRQGEIVVLDAWVFAERPLRQHGPDQYGGGCDAPNGPPDNAAPPNHDLSIPPARVFRGSEYTENNVHTTNR